MRDEIYQQTAQARGKRGKSVAEDEPKFTHDHAIHEIANIILEFAEHDKDGNETKPAVMGGPAVMIRDKAEPEDPDPPGLAKMAPRPATIVWM